MLLLIVLYLIYRQFCSWNFSFKLYFVYSKLTKIPFVYIQQNIIFCIKLYLLIQKKNVYVIFVIS